MKNKKKKTKFYTGKKISRRKGYSRVQRTTNSPGIYRENIRLYLNHKFQEVDWLNFLESLSSLGLNFEQVSGFDLQFQDMNVFIQLAEIEKKVFESEVEAIKQS